MCLKSCGANNLSTPNFNGGAVELWEWDELFHTSLYDGCDYLSMPGLKLNHLSDSGSRSRLLQNQIRHSI